MICILSSENINALCIFMLVIAFWINMIYSEIKWLKCILAVVALMELYFLLTKGIA